MNTRPLAAFATLALAVAGCGTFGPSQPPPSDSYAKPSSARSRPLPSSEESSGGWSAPSSPGFADAPAPRSSGTEAYGGFVESAPPARRSPPPAEPYGLADETPPPPRAEVQAEAPQERPGLGTEWGETRFSPVHDVPFERGGDRPFSVATVYYNDREGVGAMASYELRRGASSPIPMTVRGGLLISVVDEYGGPLPAITVGGRIYVTGEAGRRYSIIIRNNTARRYEAVVSVDGLDVIDGRPASVEKRGYLVGPFATVTVDGFRQSDREVAAFRFGSVRDSYAGKTSGDRNVGVIGWAFFDERGAAPWTDEEIERRRTAQPFSDARYAQPPPF